MYGLSARLAIAFSLLASTPALAKKHNFDTGLPIGFGFVAGMEKAPRSDFTLGIQSTDSPIGQYFAFEPYVDLIKVVIRASVGWHLSPALHGSGSDASGIFTETSDASTFDYGIRLIMAPFFSEKLEYRSYFVFGVARSTAQIKNVRKYSSGTGAGALNTERAKGTGTAMNAGFGIEFFLMQNYTMQLEGGYVIRNIAAFTYASDADVTGAPRTNGTPILKADGATKSYQQRSPYLQVGLNLNF